MINYTKKSSYERINENDEKLMYKYADEYIDFLNKAKTEYKCVEYIVNKLEQNGFKELKDVTKLKAGDKVEWVYTCDLGNDVGGHYSARNGN